MTKRIITPKGLNGASGLVSSVIAQATKDALRGEPVHKADALRYLRSDVYQAHLRILDKPDSWLPDPK